MKPLTISEAALHLRMSQSQVRNFIKNDESFPVVIHNARSFQIDGDGLNKWWDAQKLKAPERRAVIKANMEKAKAARAAKKTSVIPAHA